ncbi:MAG TPA: FGGY family carbohydrate kinase [Acidimicrobiia bacterium]|jgi:xylulokinase
MPLVAGVDSSTQSTKVLVCDADSGAIVATGRAPHPPTTPPRSEQDPRAWMAALDAALAETGHRDEFREISIGAQQHGLVVVGPDDQALRPAKLWNDTESAPDAAWLLGRLPGGAAAWADAVGSVPVAAFTIAKLSWLHRTEPEVFHRIARVMLPHDWIAWQLTGEVATDRGDASGTGYWSPSSESYRTDLLELVDDTVDWVAALPTVASADAALGTGDNMAAALGAGLRPGDVLVSLGTSGTVCAVSDRPTSDPSGAVAGFADATGRFLPLVCTLNAAKVTDAFARLLGVDHTAFDELALRAQPGSGGVVLLPYLDGERTPDRPEATGALRGIRSDVSREQLARAAVEGVVCGLLDGLDALRAASVDVDSGRLVLVGGAARSAAYRSVLADLAQRAVTAPDATELVALGATVQSAARMHATPAGEIASAWGLGSGTTFDPAIGAETAARIRSAYASVRDT